MSRDFLCRRRCLQALAGIEARRIKSHIQQTTRSFRKLLHDTESSNVFDNLREKCSNTAYSKSELMFAKLCRPGPPIHVALTWAGPPRHQSALSSLFCGDLCFGHYAANFFARSLCSQTGSQRERCEALDLDPHRVCLHCWHCHRNLWLDDESHVLLHCPAHAHARAQLYQQVNPTTLARMSESTPREKMLVLTSSFETQDWEALAAHVSIIRQHRRRQRDRFSDLQVARTKQAFQVKREFLTNPLGDMHASCPNLMINCGSLLQRRSRLPTLCDKESFRQNSRGERGRTLVAVSNSHLLLVLLYYCWSSCASLAWFGVPPCAVLAKSSHQAYSCPEAGPCSPLVAGTSSVNL